jgi:sporulation protein YlmC with PRC-barrel domain
MKISLNSRVSCTDGLSGRVVQVIVNPATRKVTHLAVEESKVPHIERLVPVGYIVNTSGDLVNLDCTRQELSRMKPLIEAEFVWAEFPEFDESCPYMLLPYVIPVRIAANHKSLPPGDLCICRGARVQASDGRVGWVDEFAVVPTNGEITHLLLREGHLWGRKEVAIPVSAIERIEEKAVYLNLNRRAVEALPAVQVRRPWR